MFAVNNLLSCADFFSELIEHLFGTIYAAENVGQRKPLAYLEFDFAIIAGQHVHTIAYYPFVVETFFFSRDRALLQSLLKCLCIA